MSQPDAGSLVVSYLWQQIGHTALKAELGMAIRLAHEHVSEAAIFLACRELAMNGWIDLLQDELPAARLTPEAVRALQDHLQTGAPMPERLERAAERDARVAQEGSTAQREQVELLREVREEARRAREETARLRLEMQRMQALPGPAPIPVPMPSAYLQCRQCKGSGVGPAGVAAGAPCPTCKGRGEVPVGR